jgi:hypothetical protein
MVAVASGARRYRHEATYAPDRRGRLVGRRGRGPATAAHTVVPGRQVILVGADSGVRLFTGDQLSTCSGLAGIDLSGRTARLGPAGG